MAFRLGPVPSGVRGQPRDGLAEADVVDLEVDRAGGERFDHEWIQRGRLITFPEDHQPLDGSVEYRPRPPRRRAAGRQPATVLVEEPKRLVAPSQMSQRVELQRPGPSVEPAGRFRPDGFAGMLERLLPPSATERGRVEEPV